MSDVLEQFELPPKWKNYFFIRRRPKLRFPRDWPPPGLDLAVLYNKNPQSEEERSAHKDARAKYNDILKQEGFVSEALFVSPEDVMSDDLRADLTDLEEHLLLDFWQLDQQAKYYQNLHYLYQWVFILGAFLTTLFAALGVLLYQLEVPNIYPTILGGLTTFIGAGTGSVSFLETKQNPYWKWFESRHRAEGLRSLYFLYLARQKPFNIPDDQKRVRHLRRMVLNVLRERKEKSDE
jgi:hypothetical protein